MQNSAQNVKMLVKLANQYKKVVVSKINLLRDMLNYELQIQDWMHKAWFYALVAKKLINGNMFKNCEKMACGVCMYATATSKLKIFKFTQA